METCPVADGYRIQKLDGKYYCLKNEQTIQERIFQKSQIPIRPQGMTGQQREEEELEAVVGDPRPEITSEPSHNKNNASGKGANGDVGGIHNN